MSAGKIEREIRKDGFKVTSEEGGSIEATSPIMRTKMDQEDREDFADLYYQYFIAAQAVVSAWESIQQAGVDPAKLFPTALHKDKGYREFLKITAGGFRYTPDENTSLRADSPTLNELKPIKKDRIIDMLVGYYVYLLAIYEGVMGDEEPRRYIEVLRADLTQKTRIARALSEQGRASSN